MRTFIYVLLALLCASCTQSDLSLPSLEDQNATSKSLTNTDVNPNDYAADENPSNMSVSITTSEGNIITLTASKVVANYGNASSFAVTTNPGKSDVQYFTATYLNITEPDDELKVIKNPGLNQTVYTNKATMTVSPGSTALNVSINPGNISTTALSIIGDEEDGI